MALKLFVDFDGTITSTDVGNAFFRTFGGAVCDQIVEDYHQGRISAQECFRAECAAIGRLDPAALDAFLRQQEIDPGFPRFTAFCAERGLEFHVLSDGLDYYIDRILDLHGIQQVSRFANAMTLRPPDGGGQCEVSLAFPYGDAECGHCAACKRNIMLTLAGEDDIIAYVGEGFSDRCPVQYADIVFAKEDLQTWCREQNISYFTYETFHEVVERLETLLGRKTLRKRRRAELKRREAFTKE